MSGTVQSFKETVCNYIYYYYHLNGDQHCEVESVETEFLEINVFSYWLLTRLLTTTASGTL